MTESNDVRSPETLELERRRARHASLVERVRDVDAEQRAATAAVAAASDEVVRLERAAAVGGKVSEAARRRAEDALLQARTAAAAPWAERRKAANLAAEDARRDVVAFVGANLDELVTALEADGEIAAANVNAAAGQLLAAYAEREAIAQRIGQLLALIAQVEPGDVSRTAAEAVAAEAGRLLERGGEEPPRLQRDPRRPRHGTPDPVPA